ncbi:MAG: hypothetical protein EAZ60_16420 [Oscillatoriales cyanobacterium]|nr:MAG: hypothetical protein EAZ83_30630 [Oscillatoriales cyanobacterium]TAE99325.1 MAG: hypothetical protein EAZ79_05590 [Oscillatoriales cyanobacterium]TAF13327.1 MAG: hypothetical protein EAZ73_30380 [Oscillatoriales cyanobacterium]TAF26147.1 MAG: hypothetical protein EAZ69_29465 [Oscillatoriales cyanobacterium]TAF54506.1 MAG: hypothetical protein EAZ60_16420 [Oscillatoriales cyanobacterium]
MFCSGNLKKATRQKFNVESASWALGRLLDRLYKFLPTKSAAIFESVTLTTARSQTLEYYQIRMT